MHNELDWKPYNFNEVGKPRGYSIDYMNLVAKKLGIKIDYLSGPSWNQFLDMMRGNSLDLMINIASTKKRRSYLAFTEPYLITSTALYVRKAEHGVTDLDDQAGKKIAFVRGFFYAEFIRRYYPKIQLVPFNSTLAAFNGVDTGLADAVLEETTVGQQILHDSRIQTMKRAGRVKDPRFITTFSIATRKGESIFRNIIQKGMDAITPAEELAIRRRWNLEETENLPLISKAERSYLKRFGRIRLCVNSHRLPLEAVKPDSSLTGISSEFTKMLGERLIIRSILLAHSIGLKAWPGSRTGNATFCHGDPDAGAGRLSPFHLAVAVDPPGRGDPG